MTYHTDMKQKRLLLIASAALFTLGLHAQMDNVVEVESNYTPTLKDADKLNVVPEQQPVAARHYVVEYDNTVLPSPGHVFQPMQTAASDAADKGAPKGFLSLGAGNKGMLDARAAYGLQLSRDDQLDLNLSLHGFSARVEDAWGSPSDYRLRYYSTRGALGYRHRFAPETSLLVKGDFESQVMTGQHNTLAGLHLHLTPLSVGNLRLGGAAGYEFFGQKYITHAFFSTKQNRESHFTASLNAIWQLSEEQAVGMDLNAHFYAYHFSRFDPNNTLTVHPYYSYTSDDLQLRLGASLDFLGGVERKFRAAPDVSLRYHATETLTLFGQAAGGIVRNDYRHFNQLTPFWIYTPLLMNEDNTPQLSHQYDYARTAVGLEWMPATGLFTRVSGGFDKSQNRAELLAGNSLVQSSGWHWYGHIDVRYDWQELLTWKFSGQYNSWKSHYGNNEDAGAEAVGWRPVLDLQTDLRVRPARRISLGVDYQLQTFSLRESLPYHRPVTSNLGASLSWQLPVAALERSGGLCTVFARGDNLLNRHYDLWPNFRSPGTTFLAGLAVTF